jgi:hypothetical protein
MTSSLTVKSRRGGKPVLIGKGEHFLIEIQEMSGKKEKCLIVGNYPIPIAITLADLTKLEENSTAV